MHFTKVFTNGLEAPGPVVTGTALKPVVEKPTTVLHVRFHRQFMTKAKWEEALRAPQATFHLWIATHGLRVRDSFSWARERQNQEVTSVFGIARVEVTDAEAIVALSGDGLFVDPSRRSAFPQFMTEWIDRLPKEQPLDYLARASALGAQFGLVCGTRSLGRRTARDPNKATARTWVLEHAPHSWSPVQAEQAASTVFTEVKMLRQKRTKAGCTFTFRGSHITSHDMIALPVEDTDGNPSQVLWCRWAPPARTIQRQAIHTSGSWSLVRAKDPFDVRETSVQPGNDSAQDPNASAGNGQQPSDPNAQVGDKQKAPATTGPPAKHRKAEQRAVPSGLVTKVVPGDGNCLFSAFAVGYAGATGKETLLHHLQLRAELVQHYLKHIDTYSALWDKEMPDGQPGSSFESYVEAVARPGTWCGLLELRALSRMYDTRITIVPRATTEPVFSVKPSQKQRIVVLLFTGIHFDALLPEPGKQLPKQIREVTAEPPKVPIRGGGGSRCTAWTEDTVASESGSRSSGKRSRQTVWTEAPIPSKRRACTVRRASSAKTVWTEAPAPSKRQANTDRSLSPCIYRPG